MRKPLAVIFSILLVLLFMEAKAETYYFSSSSGDDTRTNIEAQNPATPWKSISKLNSYFSNLLPGDSILFLRGDTFYGSIKITQDGTNSDPITLGAYGSGPNPIITGLTAIINWASLGGNLWESDAEPLAGNRVNILVIDSTSYPMGRYPDATTTNNGLLNYESHIGYHQIIDNELTNTPNWTGAEAVVKKYAWIIDKGLITSHVNDTISFVNIIPEECFDGMSYFIQNDIRTVTAANEWYYNPSSKKITLYSTGIPANVKIATTDTLVICNNSANISFENLDFRGANQMLFEINATNNITVKHCNFHYAGYDALYGADLSSFQLENCTISQSNNHAVQLQTNAQNVIIKNNVITNSGIHAGMTDQRTGFSASGVHVYGSNSLIEGNRIINTGFNGINFSDGSNILVSKNFVENWCVIKTDGGAIYTWRAENDPNSYSNRIIEDNICINSSVLGNIGTVFEFETPQTYGIYIDGFSENVLIRRNTVANVLTSGIRMNTPRNINIENNTVYNSQHTQLSIDYFSLRPNGPHNLTWKNNVFMAKADTQRCHYYLSPVDDISANSTADSNYYARPVADNNTISRVIYSGYCGNQPCIETFHTLAEWQSAYPGRDQHSRKSPVSITSENDLRFEYNDTPLDKIIPLGRNFIDVRGANYPGTITLAPYTSTILIKNGDTLNLLPIANAGADQVITLPTNNTILDGLASSDPDGTISAYAWTKIAGPSSGIISSPFSANTSITGLVQGIYLFEITITDDKAAIDKDTVQVIVNVMPSNASPVANAGADQSITLPTNSTTLDGSASTDPDGTISSYTWIKISGPVAGTVDNPSSAITSVTGLIQSIYFFELTIIDNNGSIHKDTMQVTVNPAPRPPPGARDP